MVHDNDDRKMVIMHSSLDEANLSVYEFRIFVHITRIIYESKAPAQTSIRLMAGKCKMSESMVKAGIRELESRKFIKVTRSEGGHSTYSLPHSGEWIAKESSWNPPAKKKKIGPKLTLKVFRRDKFTCQICHEHAPDLTCDHIIAESKGGPTTLDNLQTACMPCNRGKGAK